MAIHSFQVTLGAGATEVTTNILYAASLTFQNNATHVMRVGGSNVSATLGYSLAVGASFTPMAGATTSDTPLIKWWVFGTAADVLDVIYDDGGA